VLLRRIATFVPPLLVALFALPFILRQNSWWEWTNAYWLLERQTEHVKDHGVPTLFLNHLAGAFDPFFVYYAGFTLSVLAYPAALLGTWPVFAGSVVLSMVAGYLGIWWTARNLGLSAQMAVLPGLVFATTPYVLNQIYGRGAWAEMVASNAIPVMLGAITALLWHPERRRGLPTAALVASTALIVGTHNVSVLMGAVIVPLLVLCLLPLRRPEHGPLRPALLRIGVALALGAGLTAAWLLPNLWFGPQTMLAQGSINDALFKVTVGQLHLSNVLMPWPSLPAQLKDRWVYLQPPVLAMAWAAVALAWVVLLRRGAVRRTMWSAAGLTAVTVGLLTLITHPLWWLHFPRLVRAVQLPYRLLPYVAMAVALAVVLGLAALRGPARRWMTGALIVVVAVQAIGGVSLVIVSKAASPLSGAVVKHEQVRAGQEPPSFYNSASLVQYQFRVAYKPSGTAPNRKPTSVAPEGSFITADSGRLKDTGRAGDALLVPVVWSPFVRVTGDARIAGRSNEGLSVLEVTRTNADGRWSAKVEAAHPWQLVAGRAISALSAVILAALAAMAASRWARRRRDRRRAVPDRPAAAPRATIGV
jgi:hypothetical protein